MKRLWAKLRDSLARDDLFVRVSSGLYGVVLVALGLFLASASQSGQLAGAPWWAHALLIAASLGISLYGMMLFSRVFSSPKGRIARFAERYSPDTADGEGVLVLIFLFLLPAVALTLILRAAGVSGRSR